MKGGAPDAQLSIGGSESTERSKLALLAATVTAIALEAVVVICFLLDLLRSGENTVEPPLEARTRLLVPVSLEIRLLLFGHYGHVLSEAVDGTATKPSLLL